MADKVFDVEVSPGVVVHVDGFKVVPSRIFIGDREVTGRLQLTVNGAQSFDVKPEDAAGIEPAPLPPMALIDQIAPMP